MKRLETEGEGNDWKGKENGRVGKGFDYQQDLKSYLLIIFLQQKGQGSFSTAKMRK